jgi:hypothetical protein
MSRRQRRIALLCLIWFLALIASLPFLFEWHAPPPASGTGASLRIGVGYALTLALCWILFARESPRLGRRQALALVFLVLLLTKVTNRIHSVTVDYGPNAFPNSTNTRWQSDLQDEIIQRNLDVWSYPHAARFLPNSVVRWLQLGGWGFPQARDLYRLLFGMLVLYAVYRFARLFTGHLGALISMLLVSVIYPISFENYVGQLTDPMSHLSFVLAFLFLAQEDFPFLFTTLIIGAFAKESVLAMAGFYVLFGRKDKRYPLRVAVLVPCCAAAYLGTRVWLLGGMMKYKNISGVGIENLMINLGDQRWRYVVALTAGALMPILALGWKQTPMFLRRLALYLAPVLFVSSAFFSYIKETRNFMPLVIVLAVVAGCLFPKWAASGGQTD